MNQWTHSYVAFSFQLNRNNHKYAAKIYVNTICVLYQRRLFWKTNTLIILLYDSIWLCIYAMIVEHAERLFVAKWFENPFLQFLCQFDFTGNPIRCSCHTLTFIDSENSSISRTFSFQRTNILLHKFIIKYLFLRHSFRQFDDWVMKVLNLHIVSKLKSSFTNLILALDICSLK